MEKNITGTENDNNLELKCIISPSHIQAVWFFEGTAIEDNDKKEYEVIIV